MNLAEKITTIEELKDTLGRAQSLVLADFRGAKVSEIAELRDEIRQGNCHYRVIKNTLIKRAIADGPMAGLSELFRGPTAIAYSFEDPVAPAKIVEKFDKELPALEIKGGFLDGEVLDQNAVRRLAKMKGKDELRSQLLATLSAPAQTMVRLLSTPLQNVLCVLEARSRSLDGAGDS